MVQIHEMSNIEKVRLLACQKACFEKANREFNNIFYHGSYAEKMAFIKIIKELLDEHESGMLHIATERLSSLRLSLEVFQEELQLQQTKLDELRKSRTCAYENALAYYKAYFHIIGRLNVQELDELISEFKIVIKREVYPFEFHECTKEAIGLVDTLLKSGKSYEEIAEIINQYDGNMKVRCVENFLEIGSLEFIEQSVEPYHIKEVEKQMRLIYKTPYERYRCV